MSANRLVPQSFLFCFISDRYIVRPRYAIDMRLISGIYIHNSNIYIVAVRWHDEGTWSKFIREHYSVTCTRQCSLNVFM